MVGRQAVEARLLRAAVGEVVELLPGQGAAVVQRVVGLVVGGLRELRERGPGVGSRRA